MKPKKSSRPGKASFRQKLFSIIILACSGILAFIILVWNYSPQSLPLKEGDLAGQDLTAPADFQYESHVLTEDARQAAEREVLAVYAPPDPSIARQQSDLLQAALNYISALLPDKTLAASQKRTDLASVPEVPLSDEVIANLLLLSPTRWKLISTESQTVLKQVMQNSINGNDLETMRQKLPSLVGLDLLDWEADIVVALVSPLVAANSFYSPELTDISRQAARNAVQPVIQTYMQGQVVVQRGHIITAADIEALTQMELVASRDPYLNYLAAAALVSVSMVFLALYYHRSQNETFKKLRSLILLAVLFLSFLFGARLAIPDHAILPYVLPVPAFALLVSALFGMECGVIFGLLMGVLAAYSYNTDLLPFYVLTSLCGVLALGKARRLGTFLLTAGVIAVAGAAVIVAYRLLLNTSEWDWVGVATLAAASVGNGGISIGIALFLQLLVAQFLGLTTPLHLLEISRPDFPLLKYTLQRAPGTYQHSLMAATLAEQAAERVGADGLLARVGALFHDVGKAANPLFFIENQASDRLDPHDNMNPEEASSTIIRHVADGLKLAAKHRLPARITEFISEHHGTLIARYQYNRAVDLAGGKTDQIKMEDFRYPGPRPRSKETAILMLADGVEARARSRRPASDEEMLSIIRAVIERCQGEGQLDEAPLTQRDLLMVAESFLTTLRGTYHPRLEYPQEPTPENRLAMHNISTIPARREHRKHK
jgi:cyclic-di-AMP phosphodiesterase PgpH